MFCIVYSPTIQKLIPNVPMADEQFTYIACVSNILGSEMVVTFISEKQLTDWLLIVYEQGFYFNINQKHQYI